MLTFPVKITFRGVNRKFNNQILKKNALRNNKQEVCKKTYVIMVDMYVYHKLLKETLEFHLIPGCSIKCIIPK